MEAVQFCDNLYERKKLFKPINHDSQKYFDIKHNFKLYNHVLIKNLELAKMVLRILPRFHLPTHDNFDFNLHQS